MARIKYVKKAQARFRTVPVLNEDGSQKTTPVLRSDGSPKTTKSGREITRRITVEDPNQPLPLRKCDNCGRTIDIGTPYKWVAVKTSAYYSTKRVRCGTCPSWQQWELSSSLSARLAQVDHDARNGLDETDASAVSDALRSAADAVRDIALEKAEGADNIENGFGHETEQSSELRQISDDLETWADELESAADEASGIEVPEETLDCEECNGEGEIECFDCGGEGKQGEDDCDQCNGSGQLDCEECEDGQVENPDYQEALDQLEEQLGKLDECPV
jgi:hypothetical protein